MVLLKYLKVAHLPAAVGREKFRTRLPSRYSHKIDKRSSWILSRTLPQHDHEFNALRSY